MSITNNIAKTVSVVFHPVIIPLYTIFIIFNSGSLFSFIPDSIKNFSYLIVLVSTLLLPLSILPLLKFQKLISSYNLVDRKERIIPIILSIIFYFMGFYLMTKIPMTNIIQSFYKAMMIAILGVAIVSLYWKISIHMTSMGGLLAVATFINIYYQSNSFIWTILILILSGIMGSSRLLLGRHKPSQVYVGYLWGFTSVITVLSFF